MARPEDEIRRANEELKRSEEAIRNWRTRIEEESDRAWRSFSSKAAGMGVKMSDLAKTMWMTFKVESSRGLDRVNEDFRKRLQKMATFAPEAFRKAGIDAAEVIAATTGGISIIDEDLIKNTVARAAKVKAALRDVFGDQIDLSEKAGDIVISGHEYEVTSRLASMKQIDILHRRGLMSSKRAEDEKAHHVTRINDRIQQSSRRLSDSERKTAVAAASRVRTDATAVIAADRGVFGAVARSNTGIGKMIQDLSQKEVGARKSRMAGRGAGGAGGAAVEFLSMRAFMSEGVGSITKMMGGMTAFSAVVGGAAIVIQQLMAALNGVKMTAAEGLEVMSVQGAAAGNVYGELGTMAYELQIRSQMLSREVMGTGANMDQLNTASAGVAKTLGGLGAGAGPTAQFIVQLSRIQLLAPLAGMSGADAMKLIAQAQRGFDLNKAGKVRDWFMDIRRSALVAGTTVSSLASALGDLETAGAIWGDRAQDLDKQLSTLTVGFKGSESARLMLMKGFGNLRNMDMAKMVGMTMFGRNMELGEAVGRLQQGKGKGGIASELVGSFRGMLQEMDFDMGTKEGQFEFAQAVRQYGGEAFGKAALFSPEFQKAVLDKTASADQIEEAFRKAQSEFDDEKRGAAIQQNQENILQQLLEIVTQLSQFIVRSPVFGFGGDEAIRGRIESKAAGFEEQGDLLRRMRGAGTR